MFGLVGLRKIVYVALALAVIGIFATTIQYIRQAERDRYNRLLNESDAIVRERARDAVITSPNNADDATKWLLNRQDKSNK